MNSAIASLIGATVGALAAIGGSLLAHNLQARGEHKNWLRSKREEAYLNSLRCLIQIMHDRSIIFSGGDSLSSERKEWLSHFSEAQIWLNSLVVYAPEKRKAKIIELAANLDRSFTYLLGPAILKDKITDEMVQLMAAKTTNIFDDARAVYQEVVIWACEDIGLDNY